jgi:hypothetical protein
VSSDPGDRYVVVYFAILFGRYKAGIVTNDMLSVPKGQFAAVGACEALGLATGMAAAGMAPSLFRHLRHDHNCRFHDGYDYRIS